MQALPFTRRQFSAALLGLPAKAERVIAGGFIEDSHTSGHRLRDRARHSAAGQTIKTSIVIVGAGIAGLSAGWRLLKRGFRDFVLLEMNREAGGNSRSGRNEFTGYPWAAHYVPVPNKESTLVRELFEDLGVLRNGEWEERYLCHSPQERLYIHGRWQEGIEPELAATRQDREDFRRFHHLMAEHRESGQFTVPAAAGAKPSPLDGISMRQWLAGRKLNSGYLNWYIDYACRDDYGARSDQTSAWAGIHYFAAREHEEKGPLTWPEGNGWIVRGLLDKLHAHVRTGATVHHIERRGNTLRVHADGKEYGARRVIFAAPTFLAPYVIDGARLTGRIEYSPWITANLTLDRPLRTARGAPLSWDNVIYGSPSLGYVNATHMSLASHHERTVLTWYYALAGGTPSANRAMLLAKDWPYWREFILNDLAKPHPEIRECVSRIDLFRMGHAMARPVPGSMFARRTPLAPEGILFANSDLSGFSIFEEAQYHGVRAADAALKGI